MLKTLQNAFKVKDVRHRIFYVLMMLVVIRIGSQLPVPGVDGSYFKTWFESQTGDAFNFLDAFTGGSFSQMSIFALSITPYITSSIIIKYTMFFIIIQLLTIAIPKLEEMQRDGEDGRKKLGAITRYVTIGLSLFESIAMAIGFGNKGLIPDNSFVKMVVVVVALTAGSAFLMWVGEQINEKGVGNGISIVLLINIVSRIPSDMTKLYESFMKGKIIAKALLSGVIIAAIIVGVVILVIILNGAERRIPVQYSKKMVGRKMVGGQATNIPLKVNTAGVMPVIFASSIMSFPVVIAQFFTVDYSSIGGKILTMLNSGSWCKPSQPIYSIGLIIYIVLLFVFAYFYTSITFNPLEVANNMKKQGGFIPGIRPGKPTSDYLNKILNYIVFIGAVGLTVVAIVPILASGLLDVSRISFSGTSLIIIVGVVLETIKAVESQMLVRYYKGFLND